MNEVDIYPVGVLADLLFASRAVKHGHWHEALRWLNRLPGVWGRRNAWNGYLAEPLDSNLPFTRAGHGWTKRRALADLTRHIHEVSA